MYIFIILFWCALTSGCCPRNAESSRLIAISIVPERLDFYKQIRKRNAPVLKSDRAYTDPSMRRSICRDITRSGFFALRNLYRIDMTPNTLLTKLRDNEEIFARIYKKRGVATSETPKKNTQSSSWLSDFFRAKPPQPDYEYQNFFAPQAFKFFKRKDLKVDIVEEVFICLLEDHHEKKVRPYYVSTEYNLGNTPFRVGRFIFTKRGHDKSHQWSEMFLAEQPAKVYEGEGDPEFNVELKYLERRQHHSPAKDDASDPVCKLLSQNQEDRLCALVMNSSYFRQTTTIHRPLERYLPTCTKIEVSFESDEARNIVDKKTYRERAVPCQRTNWQLRKNRSINNEFFFISWAYAPNDVFVYEKDSESGGIYLRNLTVL